MTRQYRTAPPRPESFGLGRQPPGPLGQAARPPGSPAVRVRTLETQLGTGTNRIPLSIYEPTLVKLTEIGLDTDTEAASMTARWRARDDSGAADFYAVMPFVGPYARIAVPGEYELLINLNTSSTSKVLHYSLITGMEDADVRALLDPATTHNWQAEQTVIGAGATEPLWSQPELWPTYKLVWIQNQASSDLDINVNGSAWRIRCGSSGSLIGPAPATLLLPTPLLGRATLTMSSTGGTTVDVAIAQW